MCEIIKEDPLLEWRAMRKIGPSAVPVGDKTVTSNEARGRKATGARTAVRACCADDSMMGNLQGKIKAGRYADMVMIQDKPVKDLAISGNRSAGK